MFFLKDRKEDVVSTRPSESQLQNFRFDRASGVFSFYSFTVLPVAATYGILAVK